MKYLPLLGLLSIIACDAGRRAFREQEIASSTALIETTVTDALWTSLEVKMSDTSGAYLFASPNPPTDEGLASLTTLDLPTLCSKKCDVPGVGASAGPPSTTDSMGESRFLAFSPIAEESKDVILYLVLFRTGGKPIGLAKMTADSGLTGQGCGDVEQPTLRISER